MKLNYGMILEMMDDIVDQKKVSEELVKTALTDAIAKAYRKKMHVDDTEDPVVEASISEKGKFIDLYQVFTVVESDNDVKDYELQMALENAKELDPHAEVGGTVREKIDIDSFTRVDAANVKSMFTQEIRNAEKKAVYDEYITQLEDMVIGQVDSVKDNFALVNLGHTIAYMPQREQNPSENLTEGQQIHVVITKVSNEPRKSQVVVSRASSILVKRLFEREVSEIYDGIVEIKGIAREAGERTKMAVMSHDPNIDPVGACIGEKSSRVQSVIREIHGEKIDIFPWSEDYETLVKNAMAPARIEAVFPEEDGSVTIVVDEEEVPLAYGSKKRNLRLASSLLNKKLEIKTKAQLEEEGRDYEAMMEEAAARRAQRIEELAKQEEERKQRAEAEKDRKRLEDKQELLEKAKAEREQLASASIMPEEMMEAMDENIVDGEPEAKNEETTEETPVEEPVSVEEETTAAVEPVEEVVEEEPLEEEIVEEEPEEEPVEVQEEVKETERKRKHADLEDMAAKNTYVSVFEKLADTSKQRQDSSKPKRKSKKKNEDEFNIRTNKELEEKIRQSYSNTDNRPIYSQEELDEIEAQRAAEEEAEYDIDYDEYEDYYDEDE